MDDVAGDVGLIGVDFSDEEKAIDWLETQSAEVRSAIASRAALRVCANISRVEPEKLPPLALAVFRATLTSAVRGSARTADVEWLRSAAYTAARFAAYTADRSTSYNAALSATDSAAHSALSAAESPALPAYTAAHSATDSAAHSAARSALSAARSAGESAASQDSRNARLSDFAEPLWQEIHAPPGIARNHHHFLAFLSADRSIWGFWHDWYLAMWEGRFTDWDLAIEVAKIPDAVWKQGAEAVAAAIREIEARSAAGLKDITPEDVLPHNVTNLFDRAPIVQASMATFSETINLRVDAFSRLARPNERISFFDTLKALPETADRIAYLVVQDRTDGGNQTALALEVGRLRAQIEQLKADLKAAHSELQELRKKPWYKKSSVLVMGAVVSTIATGAWVLSGEDKALEERWNKLAVDLEFLTTKIWPEPENKVLDFLRFELPDIEGV